MRERQSIIYRKRERRMRLIQHKRPLFLWLFINVAVSAACFVANSEEEADADSVFGIGPIPFTSKQVNESEFGKKSPPKPLLIFTPTVNSKYPVLLFLHGTCLHNSYYSLLFQHISSHGYIIVAPQIYSCLNGATHEFLPISGDDELDYAAKIANWLPSGLKRVLQPENVVGDLEKLSVGGHSRGGKIAYALALGYAKTPLQVKISGLVGVSPVEGPNKYIIVKPKVLTHEPNNSLNLTIPIVVTGSGLGDQPVCLWGIFCSPAVCSPDGLNHQEFFDESKAPAAAHFVAAEYGHMDMLNDDISDLVGKFTVAVCKSGVGPKDSMRRTIGGIIVGFLDAYFKGQIDEYMSIVEHPSVAPVKLDPVQFKSSHAKLAQV